MFVTLVALMPPELQDQIKQPFPEQYRGYIGILFAIAAHISKYQATKAAANSPLQ